MSIIQDVINYTKTHEWKYTTQDVQTQTDLSNDEIDNLQQQIDELKMQITNINSTHNSWYDYIENKYGPYCNTMESMLNQPNNTSNNIQHWY